MVWDYGSYTPDDATPNVSKAIKNGELKFTLHGEKLGGSWALVHTDDRRWLLIKTQGRIRDRRIYCRRKTAVRIQR